MAPSNRFLRASRPVCLAALVVASAADGRTGMPSLAPLAGAAGPAPASMRVEPGICQPGYVEATLNDWLVATKDSEFESDYAALAFYELVDFVYLLRDIAQELCV